MNEIKPGDVVKLKSGSKPMTVEAIGGPMNLMADVVCERDGEILRFFVAVITLEPAKPASHYTKAMIG